MTQQNQSESSQPGSIVVVGGGLAAAKAVEGLREQGYTGSITVVAAEEHLPYERPPFSKGVLLGNEEPDSATVHDQAWYDEHDVELLTGTTASAIDLQARTVTAGDRTIGYDELLLATGSRPRHLAMADDSGAPVNYLRTRDDSLALRPKLAEGTSVVIIGAGWIGLEVASAARQAGAEVTVVEPEAVPLARVLGAELGERFAQLHRDHGVDLRVSSGVESIEHGEGGTDLTLSDGSHLHPDLVVVGIGVLPVVELAEQAGLETDNGILVDASLRTSDPHVWAAGDVANHDHPTLGRIRVEHWDVALNQGTFVAGAMLGSQEPYRNQPYFFTDQYDWGMEYVGHVGKDGYDEVVTRGEPAEGMTAFWVKDGTILAAMQVNDWDVGDTLRALVGKPAPEKLGDTSVPLADLL
ncbi:NAD(P)/FAD-dependent oxidoreductase [Ornithinimicrobium avium]|uniref:NAD(P)/FAD-dependent oxidoreductase n=1 Tax=Ornithinimicrobium avium TaxID=2283195 RepID=A0A345NP87_9MICO|nr:FAD-dependent oxidoreductase [Ornithinimicrobium avium]AXH96845.1 NAD(P)/FAD-dependent oxidoreductase [Ornithinimicrobium avium]